MSLRLTADVFDYAPLDKSELLVLMAMATWANDDGTHIFPSIATLAEKARASERTVQNALRDLESDGWITTVRRGTGRRCSEYRIEVQKLQLCAREKQQKCTGTMSADEGRRNCTSETRGAKPARKSASDQGRKNCTSHARGAKIDSEFAPNCAPEVQFSTSHIDKPVIEPVNEPVISLAQAPAREEGDAEAQTTSASEEVGWAAILAAFDGWVRAGLLGQGWSRDRARKAWRALRAVPSRGWTDAELIACIAAQCAAWLAENGRRSARLGQRLVPEPARWLSERCYLGFLQHVRTQESDKAALANQRQTIRAELGERAYDRLYGHVEARNPGKGEALMALWRGARVTHENDRTVVRLCGVPFVIDKHWNEDVLKRAFGNSIRLHVEPKNRRAQ